MIHPLLKKKLKSQKGIFLLEGNWWKSDPAFSTTKEVFHLLTHAKSWKKDLLYHNHVDDYDYFFKELDKWLEKKYLTHPILVLAFHGAAGEIFVDRKKRKGISFEQIQEHLEGRCADRIIHFSCCSTMKVSEARIKKFMNLTQTLAVSGYRKDVWWTEGAAFDLLYSDYLQQTPPTEASFRSLRKKIDERYAGLTKATGFQMKIRNIDF